jgi:CO/xanthine dehydrogenase Mo-binding subunit
MDYAILRASDMPELIVRLIESVDAEGPFGAKGLGESGAIPVSAAVANAIENAIGVRFTELPVDAAAVRAALQARGR